MPDSPFRQLVDSFLDTHCPPLRPGQLGLDVGGAHSRGRWRPLPRRQWCVIDIEGGPDVDEVCDVQKLPAWMTEQFDVVKATDVLYLVLDQGRAAGECWRAVKSRGICIVTWPWLRPHTEANDYVRVRMPGYLPLGGFYSLLLHLAWDRWHWLRPVIGRIAWVGRWLDGAGNERYALGWANVERKT